jgi:hypothetical protein
LPPRKGTVLAAPGDSQPSDIVELRCAVSVGDAVATAQTSIDAIASVTAAGERSADVREALQAADRWLAEHLVIAPPETTYDQLRGVPANGRS